MIWTWTFLKALISHLNDGGALKVELVTAGIIILLAILAPRLAQSYFARLESKLRQVASNRLRSVIIIGLLAFGTSAIRSAFIQFPQPLIQDEFSYLLAADTFAHGRLTNPSHPLSVHFETFHVIQKPTYASKYPPGQGLFLALGQIVSGHPIAGIWLSIALACAAICWMLQAYVSPGWAFAGAFLAMVRMVMLGQVPPSTVAGYWSQSFWGGAVAALGGAMVFGALRRTYDRPALKQAIIMGLGLVILANSRPYEGLIASLPVAGVLLFLLFGRRIASKKRFITNYVLPLSAILFVAALWMGYHNFRVTGNWLIMPYNVHESQYSVAPYMMWQKIRPAPEYHHESIRMFHTSWLLPIYLAQKTIKGFLFVKIADLAILWNFYFQIILLLPLIALIRPKRDPWIRFSLAVCILVMIAIFLETIVYPHYAAPITCLVFLVIIYAMRRMRTWSIGPKRTGLMLVRGIMVAYFLFWLIPVGRTIKFSPNVWSFHRARIAAQLMQEPGRHLVIVRYMPRHSIHAEWVYNGANIEGAKVLWARDMGHAGNQELLVHFKDYRVWMLQPDIGLQLLPYGVIP